MAGTLRAAGFTTSTPPPLPAPLDPQVDALTERVQEFAIDSLDDKLSRIAQIGDVEKSMRAFVDLTNSPIDARDLMKVVNAFDRQHRTSLEFNNFAFRAANIFLQAGDLLSAQAAAMKLFSGKGRKQITEVEKQRTALLLQVAKSHMALGNCELAYDCIAPIRVRNKTKNVFLLEIGDHYLQKEQWSLRTVFAEGDSEYVICELKSLVSKHASIEDFKEFFKIEEDILPQDPRDESSGTVDEGKVREALTVFDLPSDTSLYEIEKKFKRLLLISHPDKVYRMRNEAPESHQQRVVDALKRQYEVKAAYNVLLQWFLQRSKAHTIFD